MIRLDGQHVRVAYEAAAGRVEHTYKKSQFVDGRLPNEGDSVRASVAVVFDQGAANEVLDSDAERDEGHDEFKAFREKRTAGPITIVAPD